MPPVALLLEELVAAINAPTAQAALGLSCPAHRGYLETQTLPAQQDRAAWLSPQQWRPIGRAGGLALEQHVVHLQLVRKLESDQPPAIDVELDLAGKLRTLLQDFEGSNSRGRVVDIVGPLTIDKERLAHPGQVSINLLLDCDILTGTAADDPDPDPLARMTIARNAVWTAIENGDGLADVFTRTYKTGADFAELQLRDPAPSELPAIALYWGEIKPEWKNNRTQEWPLTLRVAAWFPGDRHTYAETILERLFDAIYRYTAPATTAPHIERTLGTPPRRVDELTVQSVTLGRSQQVRALRGDFAFTLRSNKDPFGDT